MFAFIRVRIPTDRWSHSQCVSFLSKFFFFFFFVDNPSLINMEVCFYDYSKSIQITKKMNVHNIYTPPPKFQPCELLIINLVLIMYLCENLQTWHEEFFS